MEKETVKPATSAMAIAGLVLGLVALLTSWMPIFNNVSFFIGLVGAIFAVVGVIATFRRTRSGKGIAIAGLIVSIVACAAVLSAQQATSKAINDAFDSATNGPAVTSSSTGTATEGSGSDASDATPPANESDANGGDASQASNYQNLAVGTSVTLENGLVVSVDSVDDTLVNYDDSPITAVTVTYTNAGDEGASFNVYDWKAEDAQGVQRSNTYYSGDTSTGLNSGTLAADGTVTGTIFFDGSVTKALYYGSMFSKSPTASWNIAQ